jgi:hypothetical protein
MSSEANWKRQPRNKEVENGSSQFGRLCFLRGDRLTTVWTHQGHYAFDPKAIATYPPADLTIERIGDLVNYGLPALLGAFKADHAQ